MQESNYHLKIIRLYQNKKSEEVSMITFNDIKQNEEIQTYIKSK